MTPVIRIDEDVMGELKKRAIDLGLVFESPNTALRNILGLDLETSPQPHVAVSPNGGKGAMTKNATLIITTPWYKKDEEGNSAGKAGEPYSFEKYMQTGLGKGYAISKKDVSKLSPGSKVIILRNDMRKRRAEGILIRLIKTNRKTPQGILQYDVEFRDQKELDYSYMKPVEKVDRHGVKVIER